MCTSGHLLQHSTTFVDHMMSEELTNEDSGSSHGRELEEDIFNPEMTPIIEVGNEGFNSSRRILTRQELGYFEEEEETVEGGEEGEGWKDVQVPHLLGLATATRWMEGREDEDDDSPSPPGLPGTTPPTHSRYMKHWRRTPKYKGGKKLSLGHIPKVRYRDCFRKRPHSMIALSSSLPNEETNGEERSRRNTVPSFGMKPRKVRESKGGRKRHGGSGGSGGGGSGHQSPRHSTSDEKTLQKRKKKLTQRKITHDRDKKQTPNPPTIFTPRSPPPERTMSLGLPVQSVDLPDYTPSVYERDDSPTNRLIFSLQPPRRSSSAGLKLDPDLPSGGHIYRSYSDAHTSMFSTDRQQYPQQTNVRCPPDRKQFFRRFQKALKYAAGISRPPVQPLETPLQPHLSRYYSENLGLENPRGNACTSIINVYTCR